MKDILEIEKGGRIRDPKYYTKKILNYGVISLGKVGRHKSLTNILKYSVLSETPRYSPGHPNGLVKHMPPTCPHFPYPFPSPVTHNCSAGSNSRYKDMMMMNSQT